MGQTDGRGATLNLASMEVPHNKQNQRNRSTDLTITNFCVHRLTTRDYANQIKLEIWGRAQHEAARRPRYDFKYILGSCKVCKNLRGRRP